MRSTIGLGSLSLTLIILFTGCIEDKREHAPELTGCWQARWELSDEELLKLFSPEDMIMNGEFVFQNDQMVNIRAFGYPGCVFTPDTTENQLYYQINDSVLNIINHSKEVVFIYDVNERQNDYINLSLMNDIRLILTK